MSDMEEKGCYRYTAGSRDMDFAGRATPTAIIHYILETAGRDADLNGFGVRDLNAGNCTWVLMRLAVEFYTFPCKDEEFTVRTWVSGVNRMMTVRNMELTAADGSLIAAAVTQWAIIDLEKRSALDVRAHIDYEGKVSDEPSPIDQPARLRDIVPQQTKHHIVTCGDIDFNRHMTSLKYISLMTEMFPMEFCETRRVARADINFLHESLYGQELTIGYEQRGDESLFAVTDDTGRSLCLGSMLSRKNRCE